MKKCKLARQSRKQLDRRFEFLGSAKQYRPPARGWIRAIRDALGMTTAQVAERLGIRQPSLIAIEQSEVRGSIELATLRRVAGALNCKLVYALVPNTTLEATVRKRAQLYLRGRQGPIEHSMLLEDQEVSEQDSETRLDDLIRETNPRLFWD